ncbi:G2/mitotic-specific cyclin [Podila epigama]|nr:G2/mitotic-specific cyclin [Podila epigama]
MFDQMQVDRWKSGGFAMSAKQQTVSAVLCLVAAARHEDGLQHTVDLHYAKDVLSEYGQVRVSIDYLQNYMEYVLQRTQNQLLWPSPMIFWRRCSRADEYDSMTQTLGRYLFEVMLYKDSFMKYPPSLKAAVVMYVARVMVLEADWTALMMEYSGYQEGDLRSISIQLLQFLADDYLLDTGVFEWHNNEERNKISSELAIWAKESLPFFEQQQQQQQQQDLQQDLQHEHQQYQQMQQQQNLQQDHKKKRQLEDPDNAQQQKKRRQLEDHDNPQDYQQQQQQQQQQQLQLQLQHQ